MKYFRTLALITTVLILTSISLANVDSASEWTMVSPAITYNEEDVSNWEVKCQPSSGNIAECPSGDIQVAVCHDGASTIRRAFTRDPSESTSSEAVYVYNGPGPSGVPVPYECGMGDAQPDITYSHGTGPVYQHNLGATKIQPKSMDTHFGDHLAVSIHVGDNKLNYFHLTNDGSFDSGNYDSTDDLFIMARTNAWFSGPHKDSYNLGGGIMEPGEDIMKFWDSPGLSPTSPCDPSENDKICDAAETNSDPSVDMRPNLFNPSSISTVNDNEQGYYWPDGEIADAKFPEYYVPQSSGDTSPPLGTYSGQDKVFICREGAEMVKRQTTLGNEYTPQVISILQSGGYSLAKCNPSTGDWDINNTYACNDDIDNDGDGKIDMNDPGCNSNTDNSETAPTPDPECDDGIDNDGDGDIDWPDDTNCKTPEDDDEDGPIEIDKCETGVVRSTAVNPPSTIPKEVIVAQYKNSSGDCNTNEAPFDMSDSDLAKNLNYDPIYTTCNKTIPYFGGACNERTYDYSNFGSTKMPVSVHWPTQEYFLQMETADTNINYSEKVYKTDFVEDGTGWTSNIQSLFDAEKKYWNDAYDICDPAGPNACQFYSTWKDRIKSPEVEQAYNNSDSNTNIKAWHHDDPYGPFNAGANNTKVLSKDSSPEAVFKGGFAGKCDSSRQVWQYDEGEWKCSGDIPWEQTVYLPIFQNNSHAGLIFPPYNFKNSYADLPNYIYEFSDGKQLGAGWDSFETAAEQMDFLFSGSTDVDGINARCWSGTKSLTEGQVHNTESYIKSNFNVNVTGWMNINVPSDPSEPVADYRPLEHDGAYSCYWNITTAGGEKISDIQEDTYEIHKHLGKSSASSTAEIVVKNITEDSSYAGDLPDMTGSDHNWTEPELNNNISSWN